MTRAGLEYLLGRHATAASQQCPSLQGKRISPHVLRHTCALTILQATGDIRKVALWLGHESIQTTEDYLRVDVTQGIEVLGSVTSPQLRPGKFRPPDKLIASLHGAAHRSITSSPGCQYGSAVGDLLSDPAALSVRAHPELLTPVLRIVHRVIATFLIKKAGLKRAGAATGAVTLIQRFGSAGNIHIHGWR